MRYKYRLTLKGVSGYFRDICKNRSHDPETGLVVGIYANEADALACQATVEYQQLFLQSVDLFVETLTHTGYTVISS